MKTRPMRNITKICALMLAAAVTITSGSGNYSSKLEEGPFVAFAFINLGNSESSLYGKLEFYQESRGAEVTITGEVSGLECGDPDLGHGFHIHECGISDERDPCKSTGKHFNPEGKNHGGPTDEIRHVGDLGNIYCNDGVYSKINIQDNVISLTGSHSIIGRSVVVHKNFDDLGKGGNAESLVTGNAGARIACATLCENVHRKNRLTCSQCNGTQCVID